MHRFKRVSVVLLTVSLAMGCESLPEFVDHSDEFNSYSEAAPNSELSQLVDSSYPQLLEGVESLTLIQNTGWDALAQRLALVETAQHSIDIQYYIWNSDASGLYLATRLVAAANRGVKVRVLLDDINLNQREDLLVALNSHPNIEIRVYNPTPSRSGVSKWVSLVGDFKRLNRRMHNKSFTVDGAFSIVGGRNIGDEYFDLSQQINFRDRDALIAGSVVEEIQASYYEYWTSQWSYPVTLLGGDASIDDLKAGEMPSYKSYPKLPKGQEDSLIYIDDLMSRMHVVKAHYISDPAVPSDMNADQPKATANVLAELAHQADDEILVESAYVVIDDAQSRYIEEITDKGVEFKVITNSMASNDLVTNHSGYAGRRKDILQSGVQLFELKPDSKLCQESTRDELKCAPTLPYGLHAKSVVFDDHMVGIGSFNFNLRSTYLNTESVLVIESESVAKELTKQLNVAMGEEHSWKLGLDDDGVYWRSGPDIWRAEPEVGRWKQFQSRLLQMLPIEKYL